MGKLIKRKETIQKSPPPKGQELKSKIIEMRNLPEEFEIRC